MSFRKKEQVVQQTTADVLTEKRQKLDQYTQKFSSAVELVTRTVDNLSVLSSEINSTIEEIEAYQRELAATKEQLADEKQKNDKVIQNFKALLATD